MIGQGLVFSGPALQGAVPPVLPLLAGLKALDLIPKLNSPL